MVDLFDALDSPGLRYTSMSWKFCSGNPEMKGNFIFQGWLAALICTKALMDNNRDYEVVLQTKVGYVQQFYWICYSVGTVYAFIV